MWSGTTFESMNMPASCYFDTTTVPPTCDRRIMAPTGTYAAEAIAGTELSCYDISACACTPDANGACEFPYSGIVGGETIAAKASFEFPSTTLVEIKFQ